MLWRVQVLNWRCKFQIDQGLPKWIRKNHNLVPPDCSLVWNSKTCTICHCPPRTYGCWSPWPSGAPWSWTAGGWGFDCVLSRSGNVWLITRSQRAEQTETGLVFSPGDLLDIKNILTEDTVGGVLDNSLISLKNGRATFALWSESLECLG